MAAIKRLSGKTDQSVMCQHVFLFNQWKYRKASVNVNAKRRDLAFTFEQLYQDSRIDVIEYIHYTHDVALHYIVDVIVLQLQCECVEILC